MKRSYLQVLLYLFFFTSLCSAQELRYNYTLFTNSAASDNYIFSSVGSTNKSTIKNNNGKLPVTDKIFHTPGNALVLQYKNAAGGKWNATVFTQKSAAVKVNFKDASFLSFWVYQANVSPSNSLPLIQILKDDSSLTTPFPITAEVNRWQRIIVPIEILEGLNAAKPSNIAGIMFSQAENKGTDEQIIYIDDIEFLSSDKAAVITAKPSITSITEYSKHVDISWNKINDSNTHFVKVYRSVNGTDYTAIGVQHSYFNNYNDYTGEAGKRYFYKVSFLNSAYRETPLSLPVAIITKKQNENGMVTMLK